MEQNNFEKTVQQKMDELKIPPSDIVWTNIEKKIGKKEKGKRGIIIFFFFFLLLLFGGYWFINQGKKDSKPNQSLENIVKKESKPTNIDDSSSHQLVANEPSKTDSLSNPISKSIATSLSQENFHETKSLHSKPTNITDSSSHQYLVTNSIENDFKNKKNLKTEIVNQQQETVSESKTTAIQQPANSQIEVVSNQPKNSKNIKEEKVKDQNKEIVPIITQNNVGSDSATINEAANNKVATTANKDSLSVKKSFTANKKHPWRFGISFSGGTTIAGKTPVGTNYLNLNSPGNLNNGGIPYTYSNPSPIKNSFGFIAGVIVEKNISPKTKISIGISYKYYSLINKVGNKIDSALSSSQYYFSANYAYSSTNTVNSYRNNFHYLDLPVSITFQLNKSKKLPLFWNAGINISQLINSNALQFQSNPGTYYHNNSLFNKTQFGLQTGFSVMLFAKEKTPLTLGPYFYYNPTSISSKGLYSKRHFSFIGVRAEILFRKK